MAFTKGFERELEGLFHQRTDWLRRKLGTQGVGKPPKFGRKKVDSGIKRLQEIASVGLANRLARVEFDQHVDFQHNYHIKGRGFESKKEKFEKWFASKFKKIKGVIYVFWDKHKNCIYVGRTGAHGCRPSSHFDRVWFSPVTRVTVLAVKRKSHLPKLECMAIHRFQPKRNQNKAATKKWTKACPLCTTHKYIETELRDIFRFR